MHSKHISQHHRRLPAGVLIAWLAAVVVLTLSPVEGQSGGGGWACIYCSTFALADAVLNILLFVPLGLCLRWLGMSSIHAILVGFCTTVGIESAQLFIVPGRDASIGDLVSNTVGCGFGFFLALSAKSWVLPHRKYTGHFVFTYSMLVASVVGATGMLLKPSFTDAVYYGQWTPDLGHLERYDGQVLDARIGQIELPSRQLENKETILSAWTDESPMVISAIAGPPPPGLASLFSIYDEHQREILLVGPDREGLVFRFRTRSIAATLQQPLLKLSGAMRDISVGDTLHVRVRRSGHRHCLKLNELAYCDLGFTAGVGWSLLLGSTSMTNSVKNLLNVIWLVALLIPLGFWNRANLASVVSTTILVLALLVLPRTVGLLPTPPTEWIGAGAGIGIGHLLRLTLGRLVKAEAGE